MSNIVSYLFTFNGMLKNSHGVLAFEGLAFAAAQLNSTATGLDFPIGSES